MDYYECYDLRIPLYPDERKRLKELMDDGMSEYNAYQTIENERKAKYDKRTAELHQ